MLITNEIFLRQKSEPLNSVLDANEIITKLEEELKQVGGIGLAAPQIGILKQVAIIRHSQASINVINPEDISYFDDTFVYEGEGCLSFPGIRKNTSRYRTINFVNNFHSEAHYYSIEDGHEESLVVAVQHEIDHLFGKLFFDYALKPIIKSNEVGRNDPCPCGSGKKFKKCCLNANGKN